MSTKANKKSKSENQHIIDLEWETQLCPTQLSLSQNNPEIKLQVLSRKIKGLDESPSDALFRTHNYEFKMIPSKSFFDWAGTSSGFLAELKLLHKSKTNSSTDDISSYSEYCDERRPIIEFSFIEKVHDGYWIVQLIWPENKKVNATWKGDFRFQLNVFRRTKDNSEEGEHYRKVAIQYSSSFKIFSKPQVFLKRCNKLGYSPKRKGETKEKTPPKKKKKDTPTKKKAKNTFYEEEDSSTSLEMLSQLSQLESSDIFSRKEESEVSIRPQFSLTPPSNHISLTPPNANTLFDQIKEGTFNSSQEGNSTSRLLSLSFSQESTTSTKSDNYSPNKIEKDVVGVPTCEEETTSDVFYSSFYDKEKKV